MTKAAAISVHNLGKLYGLSQTQQRSDSFREAVTGAFLAPWRRMRELRGTQTGLDDFWALRNISFDVQPGQVLGIIGRNGAGKSTLLKILSRIVEPTEGSATLRGRASSLLEVGTGFHPELSGRENIYLNGSILGMKKREIDRQFDAIVDFADVERFLDTPVKRYSSGMYVRLAFAVAAHLDPDILIVDEVLAVGDAEFQKKCIGKIRDISSGGARSIIFVSHDMAAVRALCTRCIYLKDGRIVEDGEVDRVVLSYLKGPSAAGATVVTSKYGLELRGLDLLALPEMRAVHDVLFDAPTVLRVTLFAIRKFVSAGVVLRVEDSRGSLVSTMSSVEEGIDPITFEGALVLDFPIARMRLMPGAYRISAYIYKPNENVAYLEAEAFSEFEVIASVVNQASWPYRSHHGSFRLADGCSIKQS